MRREEATRREEAEFEQEEELERTMMEQRWEGAEEVRQGCQEQALHRAQQEAEEGEAARASGRAGEARRRAEACMRKVQHMRQAATKARELRGKTREAHDETVRRAEQAEREERREAEGLYTADESARPMTEFMEQVRKKEKAAERARAQRREMGERHHREEQEETSREEEAGRMATTAMATTAGAKRAAGEGTDITEEEKEAEEGERRREEKCSRERERAERKAEEAMRQAEEQTQETERAQERTAEARQIKKAARAAARKAMKAVGETTQGERSKREREREEARYGKVEYAEDMTKEQRNAINQSPTMRLCVRHRGLEQERPETETREGVAIGMESAERQKIALEPTKHVCAMALAIEMQYGIDAAYAVDGSADEAAPQAAGETGEWAAAWGSWDGEEARGGALPPGTTNQIAELVAMERTLARHAPGDRVLIMSDCQSALQLVEAAWRGGELGRLGAAVRSAGGLLVEAITRHRLRLAAPGEKGRQGHTCFMWVKAHGGGIAPNAYADAAAKSHLAEPPQDVPLNEILPRACVYAAATRYDARGGGAETGRKKLWMTVADCSLRKLIAERLTVAELQRLRAESTTGGADAALANTACDRRVMAAMMRAQERPAGATTGGRHVQPTATGRAVRLRTNDMGMERGCELCGEAADGGHIMQCKALGARAQWTAQKVARTMREAAEEATEVEWAAPETTSQAEWRNKAKVAGEALEALGEYKEPRGSKDAEEWATTGWHQEGEEYQLDIHGGGSDRRKAEWCAVMVGMASKRARGSAREAAAAEGAERGEGEQVAACTALQRAAEAIGGTYAREDGEPELEGPPDAESGIESIRIQYAQLRQTNRENGGEELLEDWGGEEGKWLREAKDRQGGIGTWSAHTRRGFKRGTGAARRKTTQTMAVTPGGGVRSVAQPTEWPGQLEYTMVVISGRTDSKVLVRVKLQRTAEGKVATRVAAWPADINGKPVRQTGVEYQQVTVPGDAAGGLQGGMKELFWVFGWQGARQTRATARDALERAAEAAEGGGGGWDVIRKGLAGELPTPTMAERRQERRRRDEREAAAGEAKAEKTAAQQRTRERKEEWQQAAERGGEGEGGEREEKALEMHKAAEALGVEMDCTAQEARKGYLRKALQCHPDKGGDTAEFRKAQEAYEAIVAHGQEERGRWAALTEKERRGAGAAGGKTGQAGGATEKEAKAAYEAAMEEEGRAGEAEKKTGAETQREAVWERVAKRLKEGADAYFAMWAVHRNLLQGMREQEARRTGYGSHAERKGEEARQRKEAAQRERAETEEAARTAMREAEKRVIHRLEEKRRKAAEGMEEIGGRRLLDALEEDWVTVKNGYVVEIPWAAWCDERCRCRTKECMHKNSRQREKYQITEVHGEAKETIPARQQMQITMERCAAERPIRGGRNGGKDDWDKINVHWKHLIGQVRYGPGQMGIEVEPMSDDAEETEGDTEDEEERAVEAEEARGAKRRARKYMGVAIAARRAAQQERAAEDGRGAEDGGETAAETAWREEEEAEEGTRTEGTGGGEEGRRNGNGKNRREETADKEEEGEGNGGEKGADAGGTERLDAETEGGRRRARAGTTGRAGQRWWKESWMGQVAMAEYAEAWGDIYGRMRTEQFTDQERRAQEQAERVGKADAIVMTRIAARGEAEEGRRRANMLRLDTDDIRERKKARGEVKEIATRAKAWRGRQGRKAEKKGTKTGREAARASQEMRRERPTGTAADEVERAETVRAVAQITAGMIEETDTSAEGQGRAEERRSQRVAEEIGMARASETMRDMVGAIRRAQADVTTATGEEAEEGGIRGRGETTTETADNEETPEAAESDKTGGSGGVEIGKIDDRTRKPTTVAAQGVRDVEADRKTKIGNPFELKNENGKRDERYRPHAVEAAAMAMKELGRHGRSDHERIATEGPDGKGWWVGEGWTRLQVNKEVARRDPGGQQWWEEVKRLGRCVAGGEKIRLLCHCRWTRGPGEGCKACHCEPMALQIEQQARQHEGRRARFEREGREHQEETRAAAQRGDRPASRMAHPGGKIVVPDKVGKLERYLERLRKEGKLTAKVEKDIATRLAAARRAEEAGRRRNGSNGGDSGGGDSGGSGGGGRRGSGGNGGEGEGERRQRRRR